MSKYKYRVNPEVIKKSQAILDCKYPDAFTSAKGLTKQRSGQYQEDIDCNLQVHYYHKDRRWVYKLSLGSRVWRGSERRLIDARKEVAKIIMGNFEVVEKEPHDENQSN